MEEPIVVEHTFNATVEEVWNAISLKDEMKVWYFDLAVFKPEVGFEFAFEGGNEHATYTHLCKVTEAVPNRVLAYTWAYKGYLGESKVTWQLFGEENGTRLRLTHEGLETFPADKADFAKQNFVEGWNYIVGSSLKNYLEKEHQ